MKYSLLLVGLLLLPSVAAAQVRANQAETLQPTDTGNIEIQRLMSAFNAGEVVRHDVRPRLARLLSRDGLVAVSPGPRGSGLYASIHNGVVVDYVAIGPNGSITDLASPTTTEEGETICWKCANGADGNIHCWQLECPVIVAPSSGAGD